MQGARILRNEAYNQYAAMTKDEAHRSKQVAFFNSLLKIADMRPHVAWEHPHLLSGSAAPCTTRFLDVTAPASDCQGTVSSLSHRRFAVRFPFRYPKKSGHASSKKSRDDALIDFCLMSLPPVCQQAVEKRDAPARWRRELHPVCLCVTRRQASVPCIACTYHVSGIARLAFHRF